MTKRSNLFLSLLCLGTFTASAQYNLPQSRIWAMGNKVGLDFTTLSAPAPMTTSLANTNEAAASVCDVSGHLLFYTNGTTVWNSAGTQMPNGAALTGAGGSTLSTTQGAVIVPIADSPGKYYLFSLTQISNCKLYCNKIDMSLDGGMGDVDVTFPLRGTSLADSFLTEKMTATRGCNNSVWLMVHTENSPVFRAYHVTSTGIDLTPVLSVVGSFASATYQQGVMKFSPDGLKMVNCNFHGATPTSSGLEVFNFDRTTGILSDGVILDSSSYYGGTFSPDGTKVYAGSTVGANVSQWDLSAANPHLSKIVLGPSGQYTDLKLGPDGKIYFGAAAGSPGYSNYRFMGRVNAPDIAGTGCLFQDSVTSLIFPAATGSYGALCQGMPNDVAVPVPSDTTQVRDLDTTICTAFTSYTVSAPTGYTDILWDNGATTTDRTITTRGTYWVSSQSACGVRIDTFVFRGADMPALSISGTAGALTATTGFASYQWYKDGTLITGATNSTYTATLNGTYSVLANYGSGCSDSTTHVVTGLSATAVTSLATNAAVAIYPNPAGNTIYITSDELVNVSVRTMEGKEVMTMSRTLQANISSLADGLYMVVITDDAQHRLATQKLIKVTR